MKLDLNITAEAAEVTLRMNTNITAEDAECPRFGTEHQNQITLIVTNSPGIVSSTVIQSPRFMMA